jgi:hypothetical protein
MASQERFSTNKAPLFDETNYALWRIRMRTYLMALGFDVWKSVVNGYTTPTNPPIDVARKKPSENNAKSMDAILCGLLESKFFEVMHRASEK